MAHRIAAMLAAPPVWQSALQREEVRRQAVLLDWAPHDRIVYGLVLSRKLVSPAVGELLEQSIRAMRADGTLQAIFQRHLGDEMARELLLESAQP
jgi:hypothetical protein